MVYEILKDFINKNDLKTSESLIKEVISTILSSNTSKFYIVSLYHDKEIIKENLYIFNNYELIELIKTLEGYKYILIDYENNFICGNNTLLEVLEVLDTYEVFYNLEKEDKQQIKDIIKKYE